MKHLHRLILALLLLAAAPRMALATVPSASAWQQVVISSTTQNIPVNFVFQNAADLLVLDSKSSPPVTLVLNSDYSVAGGAGSTGSITMIPGGQNSISIGDKITVTRGVPITQNTTFSASGPITGTMIMQALDKLTMISQQVNLLSNNALQIPLDQQINTQLGLTQRENNVLGFDGNGNVVFVPFPTVTVASSTGASFASVAALEAFSVTALTTGATATTAGYYVVGDGGGGSYVYNSSSSATANGGTIIAPNSGSGRWLLQYPSGYLSAAQFGAFASQTAANNTTAIQNAINVLVANGGGTLFIPAGNYLVSPSSLSDTVSGVGLVIQGAGMYATTLTVASFGNNSQWVFETNLTPSNTVTFCMRDMAISGPGGNSPAGTGLYMGGEYESADIRNVYFNGLNTCMVLENIYMSTFTNLHFNNYDVGVTGTNATDANDNHFSACYFADGPEVSPAVAYPIVSLGMGYNTYTACDFESSGYIKQVDMTGGSGYDTFVGCRWERCNNGTSSWLKVGNNQQYINSYFAPGGSQNCVGTANYLVLFPAGGQGNFTRVDVNLTDYYSGNSVYIASGADNNTVNFSPMPLGSTYTNCANIIFDDGDSNTVTFPGGSYQYDRSSTWGGGGETVANWWTDSAALSTATLDGLTKSSTTNTGPHHDGYAWSMNTPTGNRRFYFGLNRGYTGYTYIFSVWVLPTVANQTVNIFESQSLTVPNYQSVTLPDTGRWQRIWVTVECTSTAEIYAGCQLAAASAPVYFAGPQLEEWYNGYNRVGPAGYIRTAVDAGGITYSQSDFPVPLSKAYRTGTAAPTVGTFSQGEVVWNLNATSSTTPGWVCTAGGSPGTWTAMPNL